MEITEVRVALRQEERLKGYATITFDNCFVVRDLKIIEGNKGLFVAMPSRRVKELCPNCGHRNVLRSKFCNNCGKALEMKITVSRENEHKDIAHPITLECREIIQKAVLDAFERNIDSSGADVSSFSHGSSSMEVGGMSSDDSIDD